MPNSAPVFHPGRTGQFSDASQIGRDVQSTLPLPDGSTVVLYNNSLWKLHANGTINTSFQSGGWVDLQLDANGMYGYQKLDSVSLLPSGKLLVSGSALGPDATQWGNTSIVLVRLNADGSPDTSFGSGKGRVVTSLKGDAIVTVVGTATAPDGRITVIADTWGLNAQGSASENSPRAIGLARYLADGSPDTSFGIGGKLLDAGSGLRPTAAVTQADGKILVSAAKPAGLANPEFVLIRFNADGSRDKTFGYQGQVTTAFSSSPYADSTANSVAIQADGRILVAGVARDPDGMSGIAVARYNADGSRDTSFAGDGLFWNDVTIPGTSGAGTVHVNDDGTILLVGQGYANSLPQLILMRLRHDGTADLTFGDGGVVTSPSLKDYPWLNDVTVDAHGAIYISGSLSPDGGGSPMPSVQKFDSSGAPVQDFGSLSTATGNTGSYFSGYPDQFLNQQLTVSDSELNASASRYKGAVLTLAREGGANMDDHFVAGGSIAFRNGAVYVNNIQAGTVQSGAGSLKIVFNDNATQTLVNQVLQSIAYENTGAVQDLQHVRIQWVFSDGTGSGAQQAQSVTELTLHAAASTPYWIDALLNHGGNPQQFKEALVAALGSGHGTRLIFDANTGDRAFTAGEKSLIESVLNGIRTAVDLPAANDGATITVHHASQAAQGDEGAYGDLANGADIYIEPVGASTATNTQVLLHTLAHALGLRHADQSSAQNGMLSGSDSKASAMTSAALQGQTLGALDIAALQFLFGPNLKARTGDDTYMLSASQSNFIWDGAGTDTVSAAGLDGNLTLHLEPGHWDFMGTKGQNITAGGQITVNYGTAVENAIGGNGNDQITGTAAANVLQGGKGNDRLNGLAGDDVLNGGDGVDTAVYTGLRADYKVEATVSGYVVTGAEGRDTLLGIERIEFSDGIQALNSLPTGQVTISGIAQQNQTLTAASTLADADGIGTLHYQWYAGDQAIVGATARSLVLPKDAVGKTVRVAVSYTDGGGTSESVSSEASKPVVKANSLPTGSVTLSGKTVQNQTLSVSHTLADEDGLGPVGYQWYADGKAIIGATTSFLLLTESLVGKRLSASASYNDGSGVKETVSSAQSAKIDNINDAPAGQVTISGQPALFQTLTASHTLTDADGIGAITYRWYADGTVIAGADGRTLELTRVLTGKAISASVSYVDGHGTAESVSSSATAPVTYIDSPGIISLSSSATQLTAAVNDPDGVSEARYLWEASSDGKTWEAIGNVTGPVLSLQTTGPSKLIKVTSSYVDSNGTSEQATAQFAPPAGAHLVGGAVRDMLLGGIGNDVLTGGAGNDMLNGGGGVDIAVFSGVAASYTVARNNDGLLVTDTKGHDGSDSLSGIERLRFSDKSIAFDIDGVAGQAYRLYQAAFDRTPDSAGLGYWIAMMDKGASLRDVAASFAASPEFIELQGESLSSSDVVSAFYRNVLHRMPDKAGLDYWANILETKAAAVSDVLVSFSESNENLAALIGVTGNGIAYTPFGE